MTLSATPELLLVAMTLDLVCGDPRWFPHPVVGIGRLISSLEWLLRRAGLDGYGGGLLLCISTVTVSVMLGWGLLWIAFRLHIWAYYLLLAIIAWNCIALRSLHQESRKVAEALRQGDLVSARRFLSYIVGRDTADLDEAAIWRATLETVAENTGDGVIAPLFWLTVAGPLGVLGYKAASTLDSMVGYRNKHYEQFGWASARLDDLLNLIPSRLTALLFIAAAPLVGLSGRNAWRIWRRDRYNHPSPNSAQPESAAAGALGVQLGGASRYGGIVKDKPFIGEALALCGPEAYVGMVRLVYAGTAMMLLLCIGVTAVGRYHVL